MYESLQTQLSPDSPTLKPICPTHWTVRTASIQSVLSNYQVLCEVLSQISEQGKNYRVSQFNGEILCFLVLNYLTC